LQQLRCSLVALTPARNPISSTRNRATTNSTTLCTIVVHRRATTLNRILLLLRHRIPAPTTTSLVHRITAIPAAVALLLILTPILTLMRTIMVCGARQQAFTIFVFSITNALFHLVPAGHRSPLPSVTTSCSSTTAKMRILHTMAAFQTLRLATVPPPKQRLRCACSATCVPTVKSGSIWQRAVLCEI
jgi:hypothetical protein